MGRWLHRTGSFSARRARWVVLGWVVVALVIGVSSRTIGGDAVDDFSVPGVESQAASDLLEERFPERSGATALVVFHVDEGAVTDPEAAGAIAATTDAVAGVPGVVGVTDPLANPMSISADGTTAFASVQFDASTAELGRGTLDDLVDTRQAAAGSVVTVEYGGELPTVLKEESTGPAEAIGIVAALIILFVMFRSVTAMGLPLLTALLGLFTGLGLVALLAGVIEIPSMASKLGTMIGLGVGIDYALFVLSRHRDNVAAGMDVHESIARTNATAGKAVVIAGSTVVVAILGLQFAGIPFVAALGYAAALVVAVAVVVAVTLLPALLGLAGTRILARRDRAGVPVAPETRRGGWVRWAHWVAHHPWRSAVAATAVLLVLAVPALDMQLGQADAGSAPTDTTHRQAYDLLADGFGDGFNGPLALVIDLGADPDAVVADQVSAAVGEDPGVEAVSPAQMNAAGDTALVTVIPTTKPQDVATSDLVHRLRDTTLPAVTDGTDAQVAVGGPTARFIDQSDRIGERLPWFIFGVVTVSFLLLMVVFRSILVPLKAALLNLLAIGAAYGVVVAVFQWGWGRSLIGLDEAVPIASFVPMMMFAILFGLSMDYEVFILSRIREEYHRGHSNIDSVVEGLGATAKVITAAALIMISVFLGFVASPDPIVKMMGVGLATAVALDATIVRMVLVPSTMALVGDPNWWLPRWLDRLLPHLDVEGEPPAAVAETAEGAEGADPLGGEQSGTAHAPARVEA
ncbi:MMPL family transporter [Rhabdothermincola salaria]|uniref:MMPL family transporter n=1 Tax=Rhabdothermincola salaria TaxID=2903142 RepID=UPI001E5221A7|nr:MMPL family transporter [Rhabdothermincola salaria]MCD9623899.1 MMPL family transporter [Rhabdothermincola salaria]